MIIKILFINIYFQIQKNELIIVILKCILTQNIYNIYWINYYNII
jgi:hypothetical protein